MTKYRSASLSDRLGPYWKMEQGCALVFPPLAFGLTRPTSLISITVLALALIACCSTLWVGGAYWRAVWTRLQGGRASMPGALRMAARWKVPGLVVTAISMIVSSLNIGFQGVSSASLGAWGLSLLAVLEYINYYHFQLQNFDHGPTWRRFLRRRAFPRAHMAKDLELFLSRSGRPIAASTMLSRASASGPGGTSRPDAACPPE